MTQEVVFSHLLPFLPSDIPDGEHSTEYIFEPTEDEILEDIIVRNIDIQIYRALLETEASEQGARLSAMDNATSSADEVIEKLTLDFNRARQESITKELMEIIGGSQALK